LERIIALIPGWLNAPDVRVERLAGLTNTNYLVSLNGERFVVRVSGMNAPHLGINREQELAALRRASAAGIGPEIVQYLLPEGHLITRFIEGRHWTAEEYRAPENLRRVVETVKRLHELPPIKGTFSPFGRVQAAVQRAQALQAPLPPDLTAFVDKMEAIKASQRKDTFSWLGFCHNDLYYVNFLDDGAVRIVDWEFAGMGDIYFDLATLIYAYESEGPLPPELQEYILECYFDKVTDTHRSRLEEMAYMLRLFTAMWGVLQYGMQQAGLTATVEGFDCLAYAEYIFEEMRQTL
jgi:thiamine kinase-like enzyme